MSLPLEDYALLGDGQTACLISRSGSVDWLCWPRFDDDACFAALLGTAEHGSWSLAPAAGTTATRRRYRDDTLILETEWETGDGAVRLLDFMPMRDGGDSSLVRIVEGVSGTVTMRLDLRLRFDYGMLPPWSACDGNRLVAKLGPDQVVLHAPVPITVEAHCTTADFHVRAGQRLAFTLRYGPSHRAPPGPIDTDAALAATERE